MPSFKKVSLIIALLVALGWLGLWLARPKAHTATFVSPTQKTSSPATPAAQPPEATTNPAQPVQASTPTPITPNPSPITSSVPAPIAPSLSPLASETSVSTPSPLASRPSPSAPSAETAATLRMYNAHATLRSGPVANPDSVENQRILNQMVQKALANAAAGQSPSAVSTK